MKVAELFENRRVPDFDETFYVKEPLQAETYTINRGEPITFEMTNSSEQNVAKYPLYFVKEWQGKYIFAQWNPYTHNREQYTCDPEEFHKKTISLRRAIAKNWLQSLVDKDDLNEEEEEWPENTVVRVTAHEFEANQTVDPQEYMRRQRRGQYGLPRATFKKDTLLTIIGYSDNGRGWDVLFDYFDEKKRSSNYFVSSWYHFRKAVEKDDKAWINSLKEEEDEEPKLCWVTTKFKARYADHGSVDITFDVHDQLVFYKYSKTGLAWFGDGTGRTYKVEKAVFDACVTFDKKDAGRKWIDSLKEAAIPKRWAHLKTEKDFEAYEFGRTLGSKVQMKAGDEFFFLKEFTGNQIVIMLPYQNSLDSNSDKNLNLVCDKDVLDHCRNLTRERDANFLKGLKEETEDKPTWEAFDKASDLAIAFYQQLCDEHWNEQKHYVTPSDEYQGPNVTISTTEGAHYWNPVTGEFILHVIDSARGSCDDGIHVKVLTSGRVLATEMPKTNPLERMTDDPAVLAKIKERQGKSRNRFIEFNPDDL